MALGGRDGRPRASGLCADLLDRIWAEVAVRLRAAMIRRSAAVCGVRAARWTAWATAVRRTSSGVGAREIWGTVRPTGVSVTKCWTSRASWCRSRITGAGSVMAAAVAAIRCDGVRAVKTASARVPQPGGPAHSVTVSSSQLERRLSIRTPACPSGATISTVPRSAASRRQPASVSGRTASAQYNDGLARKRPLPS